MSDEDKELLKSVVKHYQPTMRVVGTMLTMDPAEGRRTAKNYGEGKIMSAKTSVSSGDSYHLYVDELLECDPDSVVLEMLKPGAFTVTRETIKGQATEHLSIEIPNETMDKMALDWIKQRKLR